MATGKTAVKLRGRTIVLPEWWLADLRKLWKRLHDDEGWIVQRLADEVSVGRELHGEPEPWDRKTIERFIKNENPTQELLDAFCRRFPELVPPTYFAKSRVEALALRSVSDGFGVIPVAQSNPDLTSQRAELRDARAVIEQRAIDQMGRVESKDGRTRSRSRSTGGRRARGVV